MYKRRKISKLGVKASHRRSLVQNLLKSLLSSGVVTTTSARAKSLKAEFDRVVAKLKRSNESNKKEVANYIGSAKSFAKLEKLVKDSLTSVTLVKVGYRPGDNAQKSRVVIDGLSAKTEKKAVKETKKEESTTEVETKNANPIKSSKVSSITKAVKETFTPRKERARTRSGL